MTRFRPGAAVAPRDTSNRAYLHFNQTNDANRVQDIVTALEYLKSRSKSPLVNLVGLEIAGVWSYFARAVAGDGVTLAADLAQFAGDDDAAYAEQIFYSGSAEGGRFSRGGGAEHSGSGAGLQRRSAVSVSVGAGCCESSRQRAGFPHGSGRRIRARRLARRRPARSKLSGAQ